ncbi:MAG: hypothetical protein JNJ77_18560 [Planctomycetia bacterium]|nr:hypothetical protein [Planctomycetia bacterium]
MNSDQVDTFYIADTDEGNVALSRTPQQTVSSDPLQLLVIEGKENITPPKMLMTRSEFKQWRYQLEDEGCYVELRFAS